MSSTQAQLEADIEQARERLGRTLDELAYRTSPKVIADRQVNAVKSRFVDIETGAVRTDTVVKVAIGVAGAAVLFVALRRLTRTR